MLPSIFGEDLFDDFFGDPFEMMVPQSRNPLYGKHAKNLMKTDVRETEDSYELDIDLPGFKKEDVSVELKNGYLTIQAVRNHSNDERDNNGRYLRRETFSGTCARSFYVGDAVKKEDIHAKFEDGILHIVLPAPQQQKALPANPNLIEIE